MFWDGWPIERILILFVSLAFMMIGIQVTMFHYRQNFHHKSMWVPVIEAPVFFMTGIALTFFNLTWLNVLFQAMMWIGVISGMIGSYFHVRGVGIRVGGWALRNFLIGPPVTLPMMFTAISVLGLIAVYWGG
ncbi:hypothetical protein [Paenibacillus alkalitolerans]|uniref:hypothetical protein n=1 Tax=Paenibacillus alkalitolerans TaxID=2799335 RepID=UPI0018F4AE68|nr:hypothetical protein [Paenibacillus alkalitolerans]